MNSVFFSISLKWKGHCTLIIVCNLSHYNAYIHVKHKAVKYLGIQQFTRKLSQYSVSGISNNIPFQTCLFVDRDLYVSVWTGVTLRALPSMSYLPIVRCSVEEIRTGSVVQGRVITGTFTPSVSIHRGLTYLILA